MMTPRRAAITLTVTLLALAGLGGAGAAGDTGEPTAWIGNQLAETNVSFQGEALTLHPQPEQTVTGSTSLESGQTVTVQLRSSGDSPFIRSAETTVADDGTFRASFDLSGVDPPVNATLTVRAGDEVLVEDLEVEVVEAMSEPTTVVDPATEEPTESPGQPGFGLGLALAAIVGGLLLHRR